ncbi:MAG: STAS domain-containing protein [Acidimicrobiales bacterium]|nr:STAS domain-containing protein [Acidimicrobiales bacterium]
MAATSELDVNETQPRLLVASGVVDLHSVSILSDKLDELGADEDVVLDLSNIEFIDSSGLRAIVVAHRRLDTAGKRLVLTKPSASVRRLFEITSLEGHLNVEG